jgi:hypothetical protein
LANDIRARQREGQRQFLNREWNSDAGIGKRLTNRGLNAEVRKGLRLCHVFSSSYGHCQADSGLGVGFLCVSGYGGVHRQRPSVNSPIEVRQPRIAAGMQPPGGLQATRTVMAIEDNRPLGGQLIKP